jgi:hypothetical protein
MFIRLNHRTTALLMIAASLLLNGCTRSDAAKTSASATATEPGAAPSPSTTQTKGAGEQTSQLPNPPTMTEAQTTLSRIFRTALTVNARRQDSPIVVGDFNYDGSQDIAMVVKPARDKLETLNSPYAPWIVEDLSKVALPVDRNGVRVLPAKPGPTRIEENEELLLIVHGYEKSGWRNPQAQQTYLLRHAVGDGLSAEPLKKMLSDSAKQGSHIGIGGDVIREQMADGEGFIYWTGAKYAWYRKAEADGSRQKGSRMQKEAKPSTSRYRER